MEQLEEYARHLAKRGMAENTIQSYRSDVARFLSAQEKSPYTVGECDVQAYFQADSQADCCGRTARRRLASIKSYFDFLCAAGRRKDNPAHTVRLARAAPVRAEILTGRQVDMLLACPDENTSKGCRDKAMLKLIYATGLKVSELIALDLEDLDMEHGFILIRSQAGSRLLSIYPDALKTLEVYLARVRPLLLTNHENPSLFVNLNGDRLTRQGFWKIIKSYADALGLKKNITPQVLRTSFAAHLLENGMELRDLQKALGHKDLATTAAYARRQEIACMDACRRYHPKMGTAAR